MALDRKLSRWVVLAVIALAIPSTNEIAAGAVVARLQIAGIDGEGPADSIALLSFAFSGPDGPLQVIKQTDSTSSQLLRLVATGQHVASMALTTETGTTVMAFFDVLITSFSTSTGSTDTVTFSYASHTQARAIGTASFGGRVTDLCTGKPIEGASIGLTPLDPSAPVPTGETSSRTGVFKFTALATGNYRLSVADSEHLSFEKAVVVVGARGQSDTVALVPLTSAGCP